MKIWILLLILILAGINAGCSGSHAIQCIAVGEQNVCFIREVWGFNGDVVSLTTSSNVCHKPSKEKDYVSNSLRSQEIIFVKVINGKLHIYAESMDKPINDFPIGIVFEKYDATKPDRNFPKEGYQEIDLSSDRMTWCLSDIF